MNGALILKKINTARRIFKRDGMKGVLNVVRGYRDIRMYESQTKSRENVDRRGLELFRAQQSEYSENQIFTAIDSLEFKPLISIIMPLYNPDIKWLHAAVESVLTQHYTNWELCVADDGSKDLRGYNYLKKLSENDPKIHIIKSSENQGISHASNQALSIAKGEYFALLDQDDEITKDALFQVVLFLNSHMDCDLVYSDECKIDNGNMFDFYCKPDWSPLLLLNCMYTGHLSVYRTQTVREVGPFRSSYDFSQDYDLALRISQTSKKIYHLEKILYLWRAIPASGASGGKDFARASNLSALADHLKAQGIAATVTPSVYGNQFNLKLDYNPKVSIIIPTDNTDNLITCVDEVISKSTYNNIEIIPVTNSKTAGDTHKHFSYLDCLVFCEYNEEFNFSRKCNLGAETAQGEILIFLNDDVIPSSPDWIERLFDVLLLPGVGGVSPLLLHNNNTVQYAGMITGTPGMFGTAFNGQSIDTNYSLSNPHQLRNVSILNGACFCIKKTVFMKIGAFNEKDTPNGHSDGDISFRILDNGMQCAYTPHSKLYHVGNHSWHASSKKDKASIYCLKKWGKYLGSDPYFTDSQKYMLYHDFPFHYKIFESGIITDAQQYKGDILFVTHELSLSGAPIVLHTMIACAKEEGYFPIVLSPVDGPLRKKYTAEGVTVIIDESVITGHWIFEHFARDFDLVVINTLAGSKAVDMLSDSLPPVLWWIHEGSVGYNVFIKEIPRQISSNIHPYYAGEYAQKIISSYNANLFGPVLNYGHDANPLSCASAKQEDITTFLIVGSFEWRKGQDLMAKAIEIANQKYKDNTQYIFVGRVISDKIYRTVCNLRDSQDNVRIMEPVKDSEMPFIYSLADCVISPSRDDPMPVVMTEAMALRKICICSDHTGASLHIKDGESGFVFASDDAQELAEKISYIVEHIDEMQSVRERAYKIYEQTFTTEVFKKNMASIFSNLLKQ